MTASLSKSWMNRRMPPFEKEIDVKHLKMGLISQVVKQKIRNQANLPIVLVRQTDKRTAVNQKIIN